MDRRAVIILAACAIAGSVILLFPLAAGPAAAAAGITLARHPKLRQGDGFASGMALLASALVGLMAGIIALDAVNAPTEEGRRRTLEAVQIFSYLGIATVIGIVIFFIREPGSGKKPPQAPKDSKPPFA